MNTYILNTCLVFISNSHVEQRLWSSKLCQYLNPTTQQCVPGVDRLVWPSLLWVVDTLLQWSVSSCLSHVTDIWYDMWILFQINSFRQWPQVPLPLAPPALCCNKPQRIWRRLCKRVGEYLLNSSAVSVQKNCIKEETNFAWYCRWLQKHDRGRGSIQKAWFWFSWIFPSVFARLDCKKTSHRRHDGGSDSCKSV